MIRAVVAMLVMLVAALPGRAGEADPEAGRYSITATDGGFTRLDTRTGAVSHCTRSEGIWRCEPADGATAATPVPPAAAPPQTAAATPGIEARLDALAGRLDRLSADVAALAAAVSRLQPPPTVVAEGSRSFPEEAVSRLQRMVAGVKRQLAY
jgi:hypothetical protein